MTYTEWNACHTELAECVFTDPCYVEIRFDTAWAVPLPVFHAMIEMFPKLSFNCYWQNEGEDYPCSLERDVIELA
jgi:hypothetical protein